MRKNLKITLDVLVGVLLVYMGIMLLKLYVVGFMKHNWFESFMAFIALCSVGIGAIVLGSRRLFIAIKSIFQDEKSVEKLEK